MVRRPHKPVANRRPTAAVALASAPTLAAVRKELYALGDPADAIHLQRFFKTAPGEYGAGDKFLGLRVPALRRLVEEYSQLDDAHALEMLASSWHEERLLALMLLVHGYRRGDDSRRERIHRAYLENTRYINNWDLVDASAEHIVGPHLDPREIELLERLARSDDIWKRRIAIVSTFHFIKRNEFGPTLRIAHLLLEDSHDLIHKAVGWMLREVGKRDRKVEDAFLKKHYHKMPRTMLRYAIERHPEQLRKRYLAGTV
ncbi:MAG: DNA alkylation repair protein [Gemmatimonadota bacterium]|nr:DNA alkylation repair protein [Gemmatimonadota bacterium]